MRRVETYQQFTVPRRCYPRYDYLSKYAELQFADFRVILESLDVADEFSQPLFGDVVVVAINTDRNDCMNASDIALKHTDTVSDKTLKVEEFKSIVDNGKTYDAFIVIAPHQYRKLPLGLEHCTIFLEEPKTEVPPHRKRRKVLEKSAVSRTDLAKNISKLLERQVVDGADDRLAVLKCIMELETRAFNHGSESVKCMTRNTLQESNSQLKPKGRLSNGLFEKMTSGSIKTRAASGSVNSQEHTNVRTRLQCNRISSSNVVLEKKKVGEAKPMTRSVYASRRPTSVAAKVSQIRTQLLQSTSEQLTKRKEAAEQLYGEMKGMLYRSGVPLSDFKHADIDMIKILDEESAKEILSINGVLRVGYQFRTLNIYMDDSLDLKDRNKYKEQIQRTLRKQNVTKFAFFYESHHIKEFREVGAKIFTKAGGTLGGFAKFGQSCDLCILLAGHLASLNKNILVQTESDPPQWKPFATVIQPQPKNLPEQGNIDIAIAEVMRSERQNCVPTFKDETGNHLSSIMKNFATKIEEYMWLSGLLVHIWGATSKPGLGKIIVPELYHQDGMPPTLAIKDRNAKNDQGQRFAKAGDSGAVVCANDIDGELIHAIAMLMGSPCRRDDSGQLCDDNYVALKLEAGLQFLVSRHNEPITLF